MASIFDRGPYARAEARIFRYIKFWERTALGLVAFAVIGNFALLIATRNVVPGIFFFAACWLLSRFYAVKKMDRGFDRLILLINTATRIELRKLGCNEKDLMFYARRGREDSMG